jgi:hypothetical protein
MSVVEGLACLTKPWKNRNKLETYVFNNQAKSLISKSPRLIPTEDLSQMVKLEARTRHKLPSYGSFLRVIIDSLFRSNGTIPTQIMIDQSLNTAHEKINSAPRSDESEEDTNSFLFETAQQILKNTVNSNWK